MELVTGGSGFIGSHLVDRLFADGYEVVIVDDNRGGSDELTHPEITIDMPVSGLDVDNDFLRDVSRIWHLASPVGPVGLLDQAGEITTEIIGDLQTVADLAEDHDAELVYVSTSEIYGGGEHGLCRENMPARVVPDYSARLEYQTAKLAGEVMIVNRGLNAKIIRPFNVAGPRQRAAGGFVLARWIDHYRRDEPITVYLPGSQKRAMTHVHDIVEGMLIASERGAPGVYNVGNAANTITMIDFARKFCSLTGAEYRLVDPFALHGPKFKEAADKFPDASKLESYGWTPTRDIDQIILDAIAE